MEAADLNTVSGFEVVVEESLSVHLEGHVEEPEFEVHRFEEIEVDGCGVRLVFNGLRFDLLVGESPSPIPFRTATDAEREVEGLLLDSMVFGLEFLVESEGADIEYEVRTFSEVAVREGAGIRVFVGDRVFDVVIAEVK